MNKLFSLALLGGLGWLAYRLASGARGRGFQRIREHLGGGLDINRCSREDLLAIAGVTEEMADRIIDHRPYRNKLDLMSQMVLGRAEYDLLSQRIIVEAPRDAAVLAPDAEAIA